MGVNRNSAHRAPADPGEELARCGLRATRQRIAVFRLLQDESGVGHPTAFEVHRRLVRRHPNLSQKTVYEVLDALVDAGIATRFAQGGGPARYEIPRERHDHARCRVCGQLFDVPELLAQRRRSRVAAPAGFQVEQIHVTIEGRCSDCTEPGNGATRTA
jgi:Fe2+ or Zn2+ uptake regulation protein